MRGIIQRGRLKVRSRSDGEFLKATLKLSEEIQVVDPSSLPDWDL